jgi:acyl carrier protein
VMEIISFLEETFGVVVDDEEIVPENFRSLRAMSDYLAAKQGAIVAQAREPASS